MPLIATGDGARESRDKAKEKPKNIIFLQNTTKDLNNSDFNINTSFFHHKGRFPFGGNSAHKVFSAYFGTSAHAQSISKAEFEACSAENKKLRNLNFFSFPLSI